MIEPNVHPMIVHFAIAFLLTSTLAFAAIQLAPKQSAWRVSLKSTADWMFAFGVIAAIAAVAAGLQAFYTVAHDGPSHAAMTVHRNIAIPTASAFVLLGVWRWTRRKEFPSILFALLMLVAAGGLATTAWWGGRLVYGHGLGVMRMPEAEGPGHQHDHGGAASGHNHNGDGEPTGAMDNDHGESAERGHDHGDEAANHDDKKTDDDAVATTTLTPVGDTDANSPEAAVNAFAAALRTGDAGAVRSLLLPDAIIAEGGAAERSLEEYAGHHMPADMAFTAAVETTVKKRDVISGSDMATIITESQIHGSYNGKNVHSRLMETMVLRRADGRWRIAHIHWSSADLTGDHEH